MTPRRCFQRSGIAAAARRRGRGGHTAGTRKFKDVNLQGEVLQNWPVFRAFPGSRQDHQSSHRQASQPDRHDSGNEELVRHSGRPSVNLHQRIHESLVDLADFIRPTLTHHRLLPGAHAQWTDRRQPRGCRAQENVLAGTDPVALDAYAAKAYWNLDPPALPYLQMAADRGLGSLQFDKLRTQVVALPANS